MLHTFASRGYRSYMGVGAGLVRAEVLYQGIGWQRQPEAEEDVERRA